MASLPKLPTRNNKWLPYRNYRHGIINGFPTEITHYYTRIVRVGREAIYYSVPHVSRAAAMPPQCYALPARLRLASAAFWRRSRRLRA
jgi:hypothetical protein